MLHEISIPNHWLLPDSVKHWDCGMCHLKQDGTAIGKSYQPFQIADAMVSSPVPQQMMNQAGMVQPRGGCGWTWSSATGSLLQASNSYWLRLSTTQIPIVSLVTFLQVPMYVLRIMVAVSSCACIAAITSGHARAPMACSLRMA